MAALLHGCQVLLQEAAAEAPKCHHRTLLVAFIYLSEHLIGNIWSRSLQIIPNSIFTNLVISQTKIRIWQIVINLCLRRQHGMGLGEHVLLD